MAILLALTARQRDAALADRRVETVRHCGDEAGGVRKLRGMRDFGVGCVETAEADIVAHRGREHHAVLRDERDARAQVRRVEVGQNHAVERDPPGRWIVEAQQQMEYRALAGAGRSDNRDFLALPDLERDAIQGRMLEPRRIGEVDVAESDFAARRQRQSLRLRRPRDHGLDGEQLEQPLGRARGLRHFAADLRQRAERAGGEHRIQHELAEPAGRDFRRQHVLRAEPQHDHDAGRNEENGERGENGTGADRTARRFEGAFDRAAEPRGRQPLIGEGLQHANGADQFGRIGRSVGQRVLRGPRAAAHGAAEGIKRQHDERDRREHVGRQLRACHHHHDARADEQHEIAQRDRNRRPDRGLDLRGIRGEPRDEFAASRRVEEGAGERGEVREHVAAQIGDDALAERCDEVVAQRARQRQTATTPIITRKYLSISARPRAVKPKSIMRRIAIGTTKVVSAATIKAPSAATARQR